MSHYVSSTRPNSNNKYTTKRSQMMYDNNGMQFGTFSSATTTQSSSILAGTATTDGGDSDNDDYSSHWKLYPRTYVAYPVPSMSTTKPKAMSSNNDNKYLNNDDSFFNHIDGNVLNKEIWKNIPWSDTFNDIQGPDHNSGRSDDILTNIKPGETKFKCMYDATHIYFGAIIYPATNITTEAHFTERNSPIFTKDSDFEIFIDPIGSTHQYKELEINAINTVWNLLLNKPYIDGGYEHSGRVTNDTNDSKYYEVYHQKTATRILDGIINNENNNTGALWSVEFALAYSDIYATIPSSTSYAVSKIHDIDNENISLQPPPGSGTYWRINFSRVEKQGDINWTWQPQIVWDPSSMSFRGYIDMHLPDAWGYLYFAGSAVTSSDDDDDNKNNDRKLFTDNRQQQQYRSSLPSPPSPRDSTWPARLTAMTIYYSLHYYKKLNGSYTNILSQLCVPDDIIRPFNIKIDLDKDDHFYVTVSSLFDGIWATVQSDRLLTAGIRTKD